MWLTDYEVKPDVWMKVVHFAKTIDIMMQFQQNFSTNHKYQSAQMVVSKLAQFALMHIYIYNLFHAAQQPQARKFQNWPLNQMCDTFWVLTLHIWSLILMNVQ